MSERSLIDKLRTIPSLCASNVAAVYLYGSVARDEAHRASDVDIAVLFLQAPPSTLEGLGSDIRGEIERRLNRPVDLVVLNHAPVDLIHRVLRDGLIVCESDRAARIRFEVEARARYLDLLPYLRAYRQADRENAA